MRLFHCSSLQKEKRKNKVLGKREVEGGFLPPGTWILPRDKSSSREAAPLPSMKDSPEKLLLKQELLGELVHEHQKPGAAAAQGSACGHGNWQGQPEPKPPRRHRRRGQLDLAEAGPEQTKGQDE